MTKRLNWMSLIAVGMAVTALVLAVLGHTDHAVAWGLTSITAAILAHLR